MSKVPPESLLDEADFFAELEGLEQGMTANRQSEEPIAEPSAPARTRPPGKFVDDPLPQRVASTPAPVVSVTVGRVAAVGFLVLMMAAGAAGAILVFHDRVAQILLRIQ
jgi:hypothetical protein